jgi:hypothetical protein
MKKHKVIVLIPVWKRIDITRYCYDRLLDSIRDADVHDIGLWPLIIASEPEHIELAYKYNWQVIEYPNTSVSDKLNKGLEAALSQQSYYITVIGSDNELRPEIWSHVKAEFENNADFFAWSEVRFVKGSEYINAEYPCTTGVARFHRTDILRKIAFQYKCEVLQSHMTAEGSYSEGQTIIANRPNPLLHVLNSHIGIWTPGKMNGMDMDSEAYINKCGYTIKHMQGQYIIDYKSDVNLTSWEEIKNNIVNHAKNK